MYPNDTSPPPLSGRDVQLNQTPPGWHRHPITAFCTQWKRATSTVLASEAQQHPCIASYLCHGDNHQDGARPVFVRDFGL